MGDAKNKKIGILALQGGFDLHYKCIVDLRAEPVLVKYESELEDIDALIIPGGESTTLLKLCNESFRNKISAKVKSGMPLLTTCAGTILIAANVTNPPQDSLNLIDIDVQRNAYGRQADSFITENVTTDKEFSAEKIEVVFIRAPKITRTGKNIKTLISIDKEPILVQHKNIMAATFHPELSSSAKIVHQYFINNIK